MELPFQEIDYNKREEYETRVFNIKKEKNFNAAKIKQIINERIKSSDLLIRMERSFDSEHPFDIIIGEESTLEMVGLEIKADTDNFSRLKDQLNNYLFVMDHTYIVIHKKKPPEWLPEMIGIIRIFENEDIVIEKHAYIRSYLDVSTSYEWDALFINNNLGSSAPKTKGLLRLVDGIRKNIVFNRFFSKLSNYDTKEFKKFYPFEESQKELIIGFDVPHHIKSINKDLNKIVKRIELIRTAVRITQTKL